MDNGPKGGRYKWIVMVVGTGASEAFGPFRQKEKAEQVRDWLMAHVADDVEVGLEELSRPMQDRLLMWNAVEHR